VSEREAFNVGDVLAPSTHKEELVSKILGSFCSPSQLSEANMVPYHLGTTLSAVGAPRVEITR
jgi:hypothetical protein